MFSANPHARRLRGRPKADGGTVYEEILIDAKVKPGKKRVEKQSLVGKLLRGRRSTLDCSVS